MPGGTALSAAVYNFSVTIVSLVLLASAYRQETALYRRQIGLLFVAMLIPVLTTAGHVSGVVGIGFDITPVIFGFSGLLASWGIFRYRLFETMPVARSTVIETMSTGVIIMDGESRIVDMNAAARSIFAVSLDGVTGMPIERLFGSHPELLRLFRSEKDSVGELAIEHDGSTKYYEMSFEQLLDSGGRPLGTLVLAYDITRRKEAEQLIWHMAFHDGLTGLPNRQYFYELCSRELILAERRGEMVLIAFMDLDGFKAVNDKLGHEAGDRFLCKVANRLTGAVRRSDVVSRLGGDEFAILMPGIRKDSDIDMLSEKIYRSFAEPVYIGPEEIQIRASMGISVFPRNGREGSTLLKKADTAMYVAMKQGKNHYHLYSDNRTPASS